MLCAWLCALSQICQRVDLRQISEKTVNHAAVGPPGVGTGVTRPSVSSDLAFASVVRVVSSAPPVRLRTEHQRALELTTTDWVPRGRRD